jgi:hypothetical protein
VGKVIYQRANVGDFSTPAYPRLVTLRLNLSDPNPIAQINQWLANYPPPKVGGSTDNPGRPLPMPGFQIVGVEMLTKEPVAVQRLFLNYLRLSKHHPYIFLLPNLKYKPYYLWNNFYKINLQNYF